MSQTLGELIFADLISARRSTGGLNNHEPTETRHRGDMLAALHGGGWGGIGGEEDCWIIMD